MPCIKKDLEEFSNDWRYHPVSSERNQSLYQLLNYGMTRLIYLDPVSAEIVGITDWSQSGIDGEAPTNSKNSQSKECREYTVKKTTP